MTLHSGGLMSNCWPNWMRLAGRPSFPTEIGRKGDVAMVKAKTDSKDASV